MTAEQYLRWCAAQEGGRYELVEGRVEMMSPESVRHVSTKSRVWLELRNAIERSGLSCSAFADGVGIPIDESTVR
jgi:Uma2 family endonuclease